MEGTAAAKQQWGRKRIQVTYWLTLLSDKINMAQIYKWSGKKNMEGKWNLELQEQGQGKRVMGCWYGYTRNIPPGTSMTRELSGTKFSPALVPGIAPPVKEENVRGVHPVCRLHVEMGWIKANLQLPFHWIAPPLVQSKASMLWISLQWLIHRAKKSFRSRTVLVLLFLLGGMGPVGFSWVQWERTLPGGLCHFCLPKR